MFDQLGKFTMIISKRRSAPSAHLHRKTTEYIYQTLQSSLY
ncbi:hypothetical protein PO124_26235 [Bacillus licheniformis]|nr:hypothetical protein [Bacillus licheniformis]